MYEFLDRRYALAIYEIAQSKNAVDRYIEDLKDICDVLYGNEDFYKIIVHPQISTSDKKKTFKKAFQGKIDDELLNFLLLLIEKDRIGFLKEKVVQLEKIYLEKQNMIIAQVKSVIPLSEYQTNKLTENLEKKFNKKIILKQEIDKSIIGGLYVVVGDEVIDGSVKSQLQQIKSQVLNNE